MIDLPEHPIQGFFYLAFGALAQDGSFVEQTAIARPFVPLYGNLGCRWTNPDPIHLEPSHIGVFDISAFALFDTASGGNLVLYWGLNQIVSIDTASVFNLPAGAITFTISLASVDPSYVFLLTAKPVGQTPTGVSVIAGNLSAVSETAGTVFIRVALPSS